MKQLKAQISLIILIMITVPVIVHTRSLLLEITQVDAPRWVLEMYAIFFAVAFDCSIFMFAVYKKREQAIVFAVISGIVGWLFWCSDLVFVEFPQAGDGYQATGKLWARLVMGTLWAGFSAYLVFWCSEIVAETFDIQTSERSMFKVRKKPKVKVQNPNTLTPGTITPIKASTNQQKARELQSDGLSTPEIAEKLGVSVRTVRRYQKNGVA
jgi:hypothetical protein